MNARHRQALSLAGLLAGFAASGQVAAVSAQGYNANRSPDPNTPRIMVPALKASGGDKNLGASAADAIRSRLSADVPFKQLWVIPKNDINATLEGSGVVGLARERGEVSQDFLSRAIDRAQAAS